MEMPKQPEIRARHRNPADVLEPKLRPVALAQLIATVTLALSTLVVATAVSIGLAHAAITPTTTGANAAPHAITLPPTDGEA
jgi:hypothetical protein